MQEISLWWDMAVLDLEVQSPVEFDKHLVGPIKLVELSLRALRSLSEGICRFVRVFGVLRGCPSRHGGWRRIMLMAKFPTPRERYVGCEVDLE